MTALRFLPPLLWTALIAWLSGSAWSAARTASRLLPLLQALLPFAAPDQLEAIHWLIRKTGHVLEYAVLAALWSRALGAGAARRPWRAPFGLSALTALLDELHQGATLTRGASAADVLLDSAGAAAALALLAGGTRRAMERLTGALLWLSAGGGTALIALDWAAAAPAGWLWASAPLAWLALLWRRRRRKHA